MLNGRLAKKHVFGSRVAVAGKGCQTLACVLAIMILTDILHLTTRQLRESALLAKLAGLLSRLLAVKLSR